MSIICWIIVFPQIGITTALNNTGHTKEEMLIPVKPSGLAGLSKIRKKLNYNLNNRLNVDIELFSYAVLLDCLNEYKMEGNLMQALHMTETDGIGLEFRGQFTTRFLFIYCCLFKRSREDFVFIFDHVCVLGRMVRSRCCASRRRRPSPSWPSSSPSSKTW